IDFGGHPNPHATMSAAQIGHEGSDNTIITYALSLEPKVLSHAMKSVAQIGLTALFIFQHIFKAKFELLGINAEMNALRNENLYPARRAGNRTYSIIDLTDAAAKGRPFSFRKPWIASSAEIARSDMRPPFGFCRCRRLASATSSGLRSAWLLRPSHLPASRRFITRCCAASEGRARCSSSYSSAIS